MNTLRLYKPIILAEFCNRVLTSYGCSIKDLADVLIECGYSDCEILETGEKTNLFDFRSDSGFGPFESKSLIVPKHTP